MFPKIYENPASPNQKSHKFFNRKSSLFVLGSSKNSIYANFKIIDQKNDKFC